MSSNAAVGTCPAAAKDYAVYLAESVRLLPASAASVIARRVKSVSFHPDYKSLTQHAFGASTMPNGKVAKGCWMSNGELVLDGGGSKEHAIGIYLHEMTHAADYYKGEPHGADAEWKSAWKSEIVPTGRADAPLSDYATTNPEEGFAEFARVAWANPEESAKMFPACHAFFAAKGLV